jgi:hypothetical protein
MTERKGLEHRYEEMTSSALRDFANAETSAGNSCDLGKVQVDVARAPHRPRGLPVGRMAVYCFFFRGQALKIGMAGPNSDARFRSHHYSAGRAMSTLAGSISRHPEKVGLQSIPALSTGEWIKDNTDRIDFLLPAAYGKDILSRLETFLHTRWKPTFEGRVA